MKFIVLIGSYARGDNNNFSDCDILSINQDIFDIPEIFGQLPNNIVHQILYDEEDFIKFYSEGSLFIHHVLAEGKLLYGNINQWNTLRRTFSVQTDFSEELSKLFQISEYYGTPSIFGEKFLTAFSNAFIDLKNACIFFNAYNHKYIYNKAQCINSLSYLDSWDEVFLSLDAFYNYSVRELNQPFPFNPYNKDICEPLLVKIHAFIKEIFSCL